MTSNRDLDRVLDAFLEDGPRRVSDRVFDDLVDRVARQPQRPAWRFAWRYLEMSTPMRLAGLGIAAVLAIVVGVAVFRPGDSGTGANSPTPSVTPTPTATLSPSLTIPPSPSVTPAPPSPSVAPTPISCLFGTECLGHLAAGTHTANVRATPFTFTVPDGWQNLDAVPGGFKLDRQDDVSGAYLFVWSDPLVADQTTCAMAPDPSYGRTVDDIASFLTSNPGLISTVPTAVTIGGLSGTMLDITKVEGIFEPCLIQISLFVHEASVDDGFWWDIRDGERMRIILLDAGAGRTVLVTFEGRPPAYDPFVVEAMPIVESFVFSPAP